MPITTSPSVFASASSTSGTHSNLLTLLMSPDSDVQLKALRELKNRIIGNHTKKLSFIKLGLVPSIYGSQCFSTPWWGAEEARRETTEGRRKA
ncbi:hypothetical protein C1H46_041610 [Malus baccata]|uniref:Uncharacterized protein n=1 Tax=Malus baccata TaxID=106549 RepID=A0A540KF41_MALBA|nr:hypothetical protein C1H46_041610 [Malus baccata]